MEVVGVPRTVPAAAAVSLRRPSARPIETQWQSAYARSEIRQSAQLQHGLALAGGVAAAASRSRQRRHANKVCCAATSEDEEAAEQLAALEAELEALEDEMEEERQERVRRADQDQAVAMNKINAKFDSISAPSKSSVTAGRGASSHGLGSVALCGTGEVAEMLLERLKKEAADNQQPVFLNLAEVSRSRRASSKRMQSATPSSASQVTNLAMVENRSASLPTIPFHGPLRPGFTKGKANSVREDTRPPRFANQGLLAPAPGVNAPSSFHEAHYTASVARLKNRGFGAPFATLLESERPTLAHSPLPEDLANFAAQVPLPPVGRPGCAPLPTYVVDARDSYSFARAVQGHAKMLNSGKTAFHIKGCIGPIFNEKSRMYRLNFEEVDESLKNCTAAIICPDPSEASDESLERAKLGLRAVIGSAPDCLRKVVLLSHIGAQEGKGGFNLGAFFNQGAGSSWSDIEDELTSTVRLRPAERAIRHVIMLMVTMVVVLMFDDVVVVVGGAGRGAVAVVICGRGDSGGGAAAVVVVVVVAVVAAAVVVVVFLLAVVVVVVVVLHWS
eukprot:s4687_g2.t1